MELKNNKTINVIKNWIVKVRHFIHVEIPLFKVPPENIFFDISNDI